MQRVLQTLQKQIYSYTVNWQQALLVTMLLALIPYSTWLAVSGCGLLILRKGLGKCVVVLLPVLMAHAALGLKSFSYAGSLLNTCALFVPCIAGAVVLRKSQSWQAVFGLLFLLIAGIAILMQSFAPEMILAQYQQLQNTIQATQQDSTLINMLSDLAAANREIIASYAFGLQLLSVAISAMIALLMARGLQAFTFNPGGFRKEALSFRARRAALLIMMALVIGAFKQNLIAMMLLPALVMYFLFAGLSIGATILAKKSSRYMFLLVVALVVVPVFAVPFYSCLGFFDSLFRLRIYVLRPKKRG